MKVLAGMPLASACRIVALACGAWLSSGAVAQDYPTHTVTLVVPTSPGTGADITARIFAPRLQQVFDRAFVVDNRTGASGNIAVASVVRAVPDGHLLLLTPSTLAVTPLMTRNIGWDPVRDLQPVALLSYITYVLLVNPAVPVQDVRGLIALARQKPGVLNYGSPGTGTPHQLVMELFKQVAGIDITHVPYKGTAPALTDLVGGRVDAAFFPVHNTVQYARSGRLRMLGSVAAKRTPWTPDLPTLAEQGVLGVDVDAWIGVYAPIGTPAEIVSRLTREFLALINQPEIRDTLFQQGIVANAGGPEDLTRLLKADMARYRKVIEQAGIPIE